MSESYGLDGLDVHFSTIEALTATTSDFVEHFVGDFVEFGTM